MILILSDKNDVHADHVIKMGSNELQYYRFNLDVESLKKTTVVFSNGNWHISQNNMELDLKKVQCIWNRRTFVELLLDEQYNQDTDFKIWKNEWNKTLLGIYSQLRMLPWLNPWRKAYEAENKYLQMEMALKNGLAIPKTVVSNKKDELILFSETNKDIVFKLMHQDFYKKNNNFKGLYVNKITSKELIENYGDSEENPIVIQQYIKKEFEVRYTIVGEEHFACKIDSQKSQIANIDWRRYDIPHTPHSPIDIPMNIKTATNNLMKDLGIEYGALDFIVTNDNEWVFLEVNSMGQFLWIEDLSGLQITQSILNWFKKQTKYQLLTSN